MTPPFRTGLEKGNNSISAFIPTLPGGAFKGGGKKVIGVHRFIPARRLPAVLRAGMAGGFSVNPEPLNP